MIVTTLVVLLRFTRDNLRPKICSKSGEDTGRIEGRAAPQQYLQNSVPAGLAWWHTGHINQSSVSGAEPTNNPQISSEDTALSSQVYQAYLGVSNLSQVPVIPKSADYF